MIARGLAFLRQNINIAASRAKRRQNAHLPRFSAFVALLK
jgi:hypothetical protein